MNRSKSTAEVNGNLVSVAQSGLLAIGEIIYGARGQQDQDPDIILHCLIPWLKISQGTTRQ